MHIAHYADRITYSTPAALIMHTSGVLVCTQRCSEDAAVGPITDKHEVIHKSKVGLHDILQR